MNPRSSHHTADLVLQNGRISTFAERSSGFPEVVESVAIRNGRILAVGSNTELEHLAKSAEVIDLGGRRALPGLNDSHIHAMRAGSGWSVSLHWEDVRTLDEALERIRAAASERSSGVWISVIGGWHSRQLDQQRMPTREELDIAAPDNPVYVQELYDNGVLNSAALSACGWNDASPNPLGGMLLRTASGALTGQIQGVGAFAFPTKLALAVDHEGAISGTRAMMDSFAAYGLTGAVDGGGMMVAPRDYDPLYELWRRGKTTVRMRLFISAWTRGGEVGDYEKLTLVEHPDFGDEMLKIVGVGEMPHMGCHDMEGLDDFTLNDQSYLELVEIVRMCAQRGWRMSIHAVRNATLSRILDAWEEIERETGLVVGQRYSIVHADEASAENLSRIAALGAGVMVQNRLLLKGADYVREWGQVAANAAPPLGGMKQLGIRIGGGSDATRANWYSPWASIWWLVTGRSLDDAVLRAPQDRLSRFDAIASYTRDAAWFTGEEAQRGRLLPGFDADICVPTLDPFECSDDDLRELRSDLTILAGQVTHASSTFTNIPLTHK